MGLNVSELRGIAVAYYPRTYIAALELLSLFSPLLALELLASLGLLMLFKLASNSRYVGLGRGYFTFL